MLTFTGLLVAGSTGAYLAALSGLIGPGLESGLGMVLTAIFLIQILTAIGLLQMAKKVYPRLPENE